MRDDENVACFAEVNRTYRPDRDFPGCINSNEFFRTILNCITMRCNQVIECLIHKGMRSMIMSRVFWNRFAKPAVMELSTFDTEKNLLKNSEFRFVELEKKDLQAGRWSFAVPSREQKALHYIRKGWRGCAVVDGSTVAGDLWFLPPCKDGKPFSHVDLKMLNLRCDREDVYSFDMFIAPVYRGRNLAVLLQKLLMARLKMEGIKRIYGFYWNDNLPAKKTHQILRYKELPQRSVSRFFFLTRSKETVNRPGQ